MTINSRNKGHAFELKIIDELKEMGYEAKSSRSENRTLDAQGVDIVDNTDYLFQCKKVERLTDLNGILASMPGDAPRVIVHSKNHKPILVTMLWEDFKEKNL